MNDDKVCIAGRWEEPLRYTGVTAKMRRELEHVCADLANHDALVRRRDNIAHNLHTMGFSVIDLAEICGLTRQAVYNILKREETQ